MESVHQLSSRLSREGAGKEVLTIEPAHLMGPAHQKTSGPAPQLSIRAPFDGVLRAGSPATEPAKQPPATGPAFIQQGWLTKSPLASPKDIDQGGRTPDTLCWLPRAGVGKNGEIIEPAPDPMGPANQKNLPLSSPASYRMRPTPPSPANIDAATHQMWNPHRYQPVMRGRSTRRSFIQ